MSDCIIETKGLTKRYGEQVSVSNLDLHVQMGRIYGLLGRNGAGKTTTMKLLMDMLYPDAGQVRLFGEDAHLEGIQVRRQVGYVGDAGVSGRDEIEAD